MGMVDDFREDSKKAWEKTPSNKRMRFLEEMVKELGGNPAWLTGTSVHRLASLHQFFDLPFGLREQLAIAVTKDEFSIVEFKKIREGLGLTRRPRSR